MTLLCRRSLCAPRHTRIRPQARRNLVSRRPKRLIQIQSPAECHRDLSIVKPNRIPPFDPSRELTFCKLVVVLKAAIFVYLKIRNGVNLGCALVKNQALTMHWDWNPKSETVARNILYLRSNFGLKVKTDIGLALAPYSRIGTPVRPSSWPEVRSSPGVLERLAGLKWAPSRTTRG